MELCEGGAMDWIYRYHPKPLSEEQIGLVMLQAIRGLDYLHTEALLIHRDIKSGNILINDRGEIKLGWFG